MARELPHVDYDEMDSCCKIFTVNIDSSALSQHGLDETDVDSYVDMEMGKRGGGGGGRMMASSTSEGHHISISMVRPHLRAGVEDDTFTPHYVPIGPYHRCSSPAIQTEKMRSAAWLHRLSQEHTKAGLAGLMEELEPLARQCYDDAGGIISGMTSQQLSTLLLNDGCYLLLLFVDYASVVTSNHSPDDDDDGLPPTTAPAAAAGNTLVRDTIFLVENQVPLFVLQRLHERVTGVTSSSVLDCIAGPVQGILHKMLFLSKKPRPAPLPTTSCSHLLHLVHAYLQPTRAHLRPPPTVVVVDNNGRRRRRLTGRWRRATEYQRYANVRFRPRDLDDDDDDTSSWSVLDVQHDRRRGTLWVPRLRVDSSTWTLLRNLMALEEQQQDKNERPVTAYCVFMSQVACTAADVQLLRRRGIVDHFLGDDERAARGFADLCRGVVMDVDDSERNYLRPLWHDLEERCESRAQRLRLTGWLRWHGHNVLVAATFLVLAVLAACQVIQTYYMYAARCSR